MRVAGGRAHTRATYTGPAVAAVVRGLGWIAQQGKGERIRLLILFVAYPYASFISAYGVRTSHYFFAFFYLYT